MDLLSPLSLLSFLFIFLLLFLFISHFIIPAPPYYGPKTHPIIGSLIPFYKNRHRLLDWYTSLLASSPTQTFVIGRLGGRRTVVTANPDNVEHILKTNFPNYPKGKPFTDILGDLLGRGIFNSDGDLWLAQRKLASHEFTARSLRELLVSALDSEADGRLVPVLSSACSERRAVDLQDLFRRFAFDVICNISLGTDPGFLDVSLPELPFVNAFDAASMVSARRGAEPVSAVWRVKRALGIGSERQLEEAVGSIHEYVNDIIKRRKEEINVKAAGEKEVGRNDLLSRLIAGGNSDEAIRDMVISFVMAGRDTSSAALTWFFWSVSCHPDVEAELLTEIMQVTRSKERRVDYESVREMKYLEACLCETMRLFPPVVWDSKHADNDDVLPDGTRVRKGDRVTYFPYGMGRMESIWGKDWMEFRPGRWISVEEGGEGKELLRVSPYKYPVFQAGPRVCLGKDMAFVQMKYVAAAVLSRFEIRRADQQSTPVLLPLLTAHMAGGLKVVLEERR
ncbi:putative cytochrome P450 94B3 [Iris pallida]|uniref:noroxomaritidine synthase n=1 Tax=Iris pallida TaxID=29817 RepID=A0AAX6HA74_IRIPA|nr:putative cytochrome P450 94B3 [Iris pallida]